MIAPTTLVEWLGLQATGDPSRWTLPITPAISTGHGFLFGGNGLAAGVAALERHTGRSLVWATAQYLTFGRTGRTLDLESQVVVAGQSTSQARVIGRVDGVEILTVHAALGQRSIEASGEWGEFPAVRAPEQCPLRVRQAQRESFHDRVEVRWAHPREVPTEREGSSRPVRLGPGRVALWIRLKDTVEVSAATVAILGDWVPTGISVATGGTAVANSIDNTIRVVRLVESDWFLVDVSVTAVHNGYGHGTAMIWTEMGELVAVASQSAVVRDWDGETRRPPRSLDRSP